MSTDSGSYDEATRARRYAMAQKLMQPPEKQITHWAQGLAQLANSALGGYQLADLRNEANKEKYDQAAELAKYFNQPAPAMPEKVGGFQQLASILNGGGESAPPVAPAQQIASAFATPQPQAPQPAPQTAQPMGNLPAMPPPSGGSTAPVIGVDSSGPSPLDNAQWPVGPVGAPSQRYGSAIASIESGGKYDKLGPMTGGDRAYGKYQVMGNNIPEWSRAALGRELTPQQFLADPQAQEAVFNHRFGQYVDKYGPEGASKAWFAGEKGMNNPNAKDVLGTSVASYGSKFMNALGDAPASQAISQALQGGPSGAPTTAPVQVAQAGQPSAEIYRLLSSRNPTLKAIGQAQLQQTMKQDAPTDETKEYNLYASQARAAGQPVKSFFEYKTDLKKAGAQSINIDQKTEGAFDKKAADLQATRFNDLASEAPAATQMMSDIQTLQALGSKIGTGKTAQFKEAVGPMAQALGIPVDGLDDIQAYQAVVNRLAPSLRVKGSGAQSDLELANFLKSLPSLGNTPGGNEMIAATMNGFQQNKMRAAEIGSQALNKEITRSEAEKQLRALPDPLAEWRKSYKESSAKPAAAAAPAAPKAGETIDGYRFKGGNPADKKNWEQVI